MLSPSVLDLTTLILATYYLAITVTKLHGPFALAERLRHAVYHHRGYRLLDLGWSVGVEPRWLRQAGGQDGHVVASEQLSDDWVAAGVGCPLCVSLYAAAALILLVALLPGAQPVVSVLAVAGGASLLFSLGRYW